MRVKLLAAAVAASLGSFGLGQSAVAGGWDDGHAASGVVHVPTAVYYPAPGRHKRCTRHPRPGCFAHPYVVYRYAGSSYPRHFYRWGGYGWNR